MAKDNTLERLEIDVYDYIDVYDNAALNNRKMLKINMNQFTSLKSIDIKTSSQTRSMVSDLLTLNAADMMPNVESVSIRGPNLSAFSFAFIKNVPNLQKLWINNVECISQSEFCAKIMQTFESPNKPNENGKLQRLFKVTTEIECFNWPRVKPCDCTQRKTIMRDLNFPLYA